MSLLCLPLKHLAPIAGWGSSFLRQCLEPRIGLLKAMLAAPSWSLTSDALWVEWYVAPQPSRLSPSPPFLPFFVLFFLLSRHVCPLCFLISLFLILRYLFVCEYAHTMACMWSSEDDLPEESRWVLELEHRLTGLVAKYLYPPSLLTRPLYFILNSLNFK